MLHHLGLDAFSPTRPRKAWLWAAAIVIALVTDGRVALAWGTPVPADPRRIDEAIAETTALRWVRALSKNDSRAALALSALPFTVSGNVFDPDIDPAGRARTPAQLKSLLARLVRNSEIESEFSQYLAPPSRDFRRRVRVTAERARVSFQYDSNWLPDGTYVDAFLDVVMGADGVPVVNAATFTRFSLN